MKARFLRSAAVKSRARRASTIGLFLTLFASAAHAQGHQGQRGATDADREVRAVMLQDTADGPSEAPSDRSA